MKRNEVNLWIKNHRAAFPEWGDWYDKPGPTARAIVFESYVKLLYRVELADAAMATEAMSEGRIKKPFNEEDHVTAIIQAAASLARDRRRALTPNRIDGQETFACPYCEDGGIVVCWKRNLTSTMAVICHCEAGDRIANSRTNGRQELANHQRYDTKLCYRVGDDSEHWQRIRERAKT